MKTTTAAVLAMWWGIFGVAWFMSNADKPLAFRLIVIFLACACVSVGVRLIIQAAREAAREDSDR